MSLSRKSLSDISPSLRTVSPKLFKALDQQLACLYFFFFFECFCSTRLNLFNSAHRALIQANQLNFHSFIARLSLGVSIDPAEPCVGTK